MITSTVIPEPMHTPATKNVTAGHIGICRRVAATSAGTATAAIPRAGTAPWKNASNPGRSRVEWEMAGTSVRAPARNPTIRSITV